MEHVTEVGQIPYVDLDQILHRIFLIAFSLVLRHYLVP
jgi:hypothetical protein